MGLDFVFHGQVHHRRENLGCGFRFAIAGQRGEPDRRVRFHRGGREAWLAARSADGVSALEERCVI